jgi:predicted DNA-binding transcriptional regulator
MLEVREHDIYKFLMKNGDKMRVEEVVVALGKDKETKQAIKERILIMTRFGIVAIEGDFVVIKRPQGVSEI